MSSSQRPELSKNNPYWVERHRYYELKHFCLQYPIWKKARAAIDGMTGHRYEIALYSQTGYCSDPTATAADARLFYSNRIELVESTCKNTDLILWSYILVGVTEGIPYDVLNARLTVPCSKDAYYNLYRKFFWLLSKARQ